MSRGVSTAALVVVLAGLAGYIVFVDQPASDTPTTEKAFAGLAAENIEELVVTAGGDRTRARRAGDGWTIVEPITTEADASELNPIAANLATTDIVRVVEEKAADLAAYGLEKPAIDVAFKVKGSPTERHLALGEKAPAGGGIYARIDANPRVVLLGAFLEATFNRNTFALRDKTILKFDRAKVTSVDIVSGTDRLRFAKRDADWRIVAPVEARADFAAVEGMLERVASTHMQSIVPAENANQGSFGFASPSTTITVAAGGTPVTLTLGGTDKALVYARDSVRPLVFTVAPALRDEVVKPASEFRRKDVFDFRSFTLTKLEVVRGTDTLVAVKSKGTDGKDVWKNGAGKTLDTMKVEDMLTTVSSLRATSFEPGTHASLKTPALTVTATFEAGTEKLTIGRSGADATAARADEPGYVRLDANAVDAAVTALDVLK
jgi:hypothetical protein